MSKTAISLSEAIYEDLGSPKSKIAKACGYDDSQKSRIRGGGMGITLDKIDEELNSSRGPGNKVKSINQGSYSKFRKGNVTEEERSREEIH